MEPKSQIHRLPQVRSDWACHRYGWRLSSPPGGSAASQRWPLAKVNCQGMNGKPSQVDYDADGLPYYPYCQTLFDRRAMVLIGNVFFYLNIKTTCKCLLGVIAEWFVVTQIWNGVNVCMMYIGVYRVFTILMHISNV